LKKTKDACTNKLNVLQKHVHVPCLMGSVHVTLTSLFVKIVPIYLRTVCFFC